MQGCLFLCQPREFDRSSITSNRHEQLPHTQTMDKENVEFNMDRPIEVQHYRKSIILSPERRTSTFDRNMAMSFLTRQVIPQRIVSQEICALSDDDTPGYGSKSTTMYINCTLCHSQISGSSIQLPCQHHFHVECIHYQLETQINQKNTQLYCKCGCKIPPSIFKHYTISNLPVQKLIRNQLDYILANNPMMKKCNNNNCEYFYVYDEKLQISAQESQYCPLCLMNNV